MRNQNSIPKHFWKDFRWKYIKHKQRNQILNGYIFSLFSHNVSVDNCVLENNSHILTLRRHNLKVESLLQYLPTLTGIDGMRVMTFLVYNSFYTVVQQCSNCLLKKFCVSNKMNLMLYRIDFTTLMHSVTSLYVFKFAIIFLVYYKHI